MANGNLNFGLRERDMNLAKLQVKYKIFIEQANWINVASKFMFLKVISNLHLDGNKL
jgi:hypothetical protein